MLCEKMHNMTLFLMRDKFIWHLSHYVWSESLDEGHIL